MLIVGQTFYSISWTVPRRSRVFLFPILRRARHFCASTAAAACRPSAARARWVSAGIAAGHGGSMSPSRPIWHDILSPSDSNRPPRAVADWQTLPCPSVRCRCRPRSVAGSRCPDGHRRSGLWRLSWRFVTRRIPACSAVARDTVCPPSPSGRASAWRSLPVYRR